MVGQMLMVLLGIMVSQSMSLLIGGVADADERLVDRGGLTARGSRLGSGSTRLGSGSARLGDWASQA
jgi:hypothetical protein